MIELSLTSGLVTQIDDEFEYLNQYKWYAKKEGRASNYRYYAARMISIKNTRMIIRMHRVIMETKLGRPLLRTEEIDHINHDGLKNTLDNLRITTHSQNIMNSRKQGTHTSSQYQGVTWNKDRSKWFAQIRKNGKPIYLGLFANEDDAAHIVDAAKKIYHGKYAHLNFPEM
jgi:hypothetical protein